MAVVKVKCPGCGEEQVDKYGLSKTGIQRYCCRNKDCRKNIFQLEYRYKGCAPGIEEKIIKMAANASGIRDTARVLGITTDKVMSTLKKRKI